MYKDIIRITTRKSPLVLSQAYYIKAKLIHYNPGIKVKIIPITTSGDNIFNISLLKKDNKRSFIK